MLTHTCLTYLDDREVKVLNNDSHWQANYMLTHTGLTSLTSLDDPEVKLKALPVNLHLTSSDDCEVKVIGQCVTNCKKHL